MASINGVSGSNMMSSLYNSKNIVSGLASGLDTEGMIESLVQSYQKKINGLNQKVTKTEWQQEAYRSIISKMAAFTNKYTSYGSSTNLLSSSFFNSAIKVATSGLYADRVTASGRTDSNIVLNEVSQLATAARYTTASSLSSGNGKSIVADEALNLEGTTPLGSLQGSLSLVYGSKTLSINFDQVADVKRMDELRAQLKKDNGDVDPSEAEVLAALINDKLADQKITLNSGESVAATERISVTANPDGRIVFEDKSTAGNAVYMSRASGNVADVLGLNLENASKDRPSVLTVKSDLKLTKEVDKAEYLSGKTMNMTLDGVSRSFKLPEIAKKDDGSYVIKDGDKELEYTAQNYADVLGKAVNKAFGSKVNTKLEDGKLKFELGNGATNLLINSDVGETLGIGRTATSYLNTNKTLGSLMDKDAWKNLTPTGEKDAKNNDLYAFKLNGVTIGNYSKDTKLSEIISDINENTKAGVKVSYSKSTGEFVFTARDTGAGGKVEFDSDLAQAMFGGTGSFTAGQDSKFVVTVNGTQMEMSRASNSVEIDGMTLNFKDEFSSAKLDENGKPVIENGKTVYNTSDSVTFKSSSDSDKIVDAVKSMISDYNEMIAEIKKAYSTLPTQKANGAYYEPLTDDEMADLSDSAVERYEEKAKQGILFGDSMLSGLYEKLSYIFSPAGEDGSVLRQMGIGSSYSSVDGTLSITLDEDKLRAMLDSDPDKVMEAFTKSTENGASTNGVMQNMKTYLDSYAKLTGEPKGLLVQHAGTPLSSLSLLNNTLQDKIDSLNDDIETWQNKLSDQVDRYTSQFSRLEMLINQMNSQSSTLMGMMGG